MMVWSINILILSVFFLIVGMIKPKWLFFWMEKPSRMPVILLSSILFMVAAVMFGEASNEKKNEQNTAQSTAELTDTAPVPTTSE